MAVGSVGSGCCRNVCSCSTVEPPSRRLPITQKRGRAVSKVIKYVRRSFHSSLAMVGHVHKKNELFEIFVNQLTPSYFPNGQVESVQHVRENYGGCYLTK